MKRLVDAIENFHKKKILVIGDVMLDGYIDGVVERISPEAPVPVVRVKNEWYVPGGAANVANNIASLGGYACILGVCGNDENGSKLENLLSNGRIRNCLVKDNGRKTTAKFRVIADRRQQIVRYEKEDRHQIPGNIQSKLIKTVENLIDAIDAIVMADYNKGVFSMGLSQEIIKASQEKGKMVIVDPKPSNIRYFQGCYVVRPNLKEAAEITKIDYDASKKWIRDGDTGLFINMAKKLRRIARSRYSIISEEHGLFVYEGNSKGKWIGTNAKEVIDVTGAGDTVIAALSLGLASGLNIYDTAILANYAAGKVVSKVGTATLTKEELIDAMQKI